MFIPFLAFWLGGVAEAVATPGAGAAEKAKGVGKATGAFVLGLVGCVILVEAIEASSGVKSSGTI